MAEQLNIFFNSSNIAKASKLIKNAKAMFEKEYMSLLAGITAEEFVSLVNGIT